MDVKGNNWPKLMWEQAEENPVLSQRKRGTWRILLDAGLKVVLAMMLGLLVLGMSLAFGMDLI